MIQYVDLMEYKNYPENILIFNFFFLITGNTVAPA